MKPLRRLSRSRHSIPCSQCGPSVDPRLRLTQLPAMATHARRLPSEIDTKDFKQKLMSVKVAQSPFDVNDETAPVRMGQAPAQPAPTRRGRRSPSSSAASSSRSGSPPPRRRRPTRSPSRRPSRPRTPRCSRSPPRRHSRRMTPARSLSPPRRRTAPTPGHPAASSASRAALMSDIPPWQVQTGPSRPDTYQVAILRGALSWRTYGILARRLRQYFVFADKKCHHESSEGFVVVVGFPINLVSKLIRRHFADILGKHRLVVEQNRSASCSRTAGPGPRPRSRAEQRTRLRASGAPQTRSISWVRVELRFMCGRRLGRHRNRRFLAPRHLGAAAAPPAKACSSCSSRARWPSEASCSELDAGPDQFLGEVPKPSPGPTASESRRASPSASFAARRRSPGENHPAFLRSLSRALSLGSLD